MAVRDVTGCAMEHIFCRPDETGGRNAGELETAAMCEAALRVLGRLKPEQGQAIRLHVLEGMTFQEAAEAAGVTAHSTMQYRCGAGLEAMRRGPSITKLQEAADSVVYLPYVMGAHALLDTGAIHKEGQHMTVCPPDWDDAGAAEVRMWRARFDARLEKLPEDERKRLLADRRRINGELYRKEALLHAQLYGIPFASDCRPVSHRQRRDRDRNLNRREHIEANRVAAQLAERLRKRASEQDLPRTAKVAAIAESWLRRHGPELANYRRPHHAG